MYQAFFQAVIVLIFTQFSKLIIIGPILHVRKLRLREMKQSGPIKLMAEVEFGSKSGCKDFTLYHYVAVFLTTKNYSPAMFYHEIANFIY